MIGYNFQMRMLLGDMYVGQVYVLSSENIYGVMYPTQSV